MARHEKGADCLSRVDLLRQRERFAAFRAFPSWCTHNRREPTRVLLNEPSVSVNSRGSWAWTRDTGDWAGAAQAQIVSYLSSTTKPSDTILAHMSWNAFNPSALSQIKAGLGKRGISLCQAYVGKTAPAKLPNNLPC